MKPYFKAGLLNYRTSIIYIFSYLSGSFNTDQKREILDHHYSYLKKVLTPAHLQTLFKQGFICYQDHTTSNKYDILLTPSYMLEFEGSLSIFLLMNDIKIATVSFSIAPGSIFDLPDQHVIYISNLQRSGEHYEDINKATKHFNDIIPAVILMKVIEALALVLKISTCIGISAQNQLTSIIREDREKFHSIYDEFWFNNGGVLKNSDYIIPLPIAQKPILLIKQTHRNRTVKKREKLKSIYEKTCQNLFSIFHQC